MQSNGCKNGIALIETGGTISTAEENGYLAAGRVLLKDKFPTVPFVRSLRPVTVLSENEKFDDINRICACVREQVENGGSDGIIVTHGTDSLAFFAAASSLMLCGINIPVVIVSADLPLDDERSNGRDNMLGAYEFIKSVPCGGVYVAYKNAGENVKIHCGARLNLSRGFDGYVSSAAGKIAGEIVGGKFKPCGNVFTCSAAEWKESEWTLPDESENKTLYITPYVGLDYKSLNDYARENGFEIMHDSFHSGTVKTAGENSVNALSVPVFLAGKADGNSYESEKYLNGNIRAYKNIAPAALYFKLVLSRGFDGKKRENYLKADVSGEYF